MECTDIFVTLESEFIIMERLKELLNREDVRGVVCSSAGEIVGGYAILRYLLKKWDGV